MKKLKHETISASRALDSMWATVDKIRDEMIGATVKERPRDSFTVAEFAEHYGITVSGAAGKLKRMRELGKVTQLFALIPRLGDGKLFRTAIYIPVNANEKKSGERRVERLRYGRRS